MKSKYNAKKTVVDGYKFDSKMEAKRYQQLKLLEKAGEIEDLEVHPKFTLLQPSDISFVIVKKGGKDEVKRNKHASITYVADFRYILPKEHKTIVEDVKGVKTAIYKLKRTWFVAMCAKYYIFKEVYM